MCRLKLTGYLLTQVESSKAYLMMLSHHSIMDGFSSRLFVSEMETVHSLIQRGFSPDNAPQPLQYADFSLWQRSQLSSGAWTPQVSSCFLSALHFFRCCTMLQDRTCSEVLCHRQYS